MKKTLFISMGLLAVLAFSCSRKDSPVSNPGNKEAEKEEIITITVGAPEDIESKVAFAYEEEARKLKITWEDGDKIVLQQGENAYPFTATSISEDGKMASFTGTGPGEGTYTVFYAGNGSEAMSFADVQAMAYTAQAQSANASTGHLKFAALLSGVTFKPGQDDIFFTQDWAQEKGGTYRQSGAIRIRLQNPGITGLKSVSLVAPSAIFPKTNELEEASDTLKITLPDVSIADTDPIVVYAMLPWSQDGISLPAGNYTVSVATADYDVWTKTKAFAATTLSPVAVNSIGLNKTDFVLHDFYGGTGVEEDPYLIANSRQLQNMNSAVGEDKEPYFRLVQDIDMTGVSWTVINQPTESDANKVYDNMTHMPMHLDGNNKEISNLKLPKNAYSALIGYLWGSVKDLSFKTVENGGGTSGVLAALAGSPDHPAVIDNVDIDGISIKTNNSYMGTLVGRCNNATVKNCEIRNATIQSTGSAVSLLIGQIVGSTTSVESCKVYGPATLSGTNNIGGIVGYTSKSAASIKDCHLVGNSTDSTIVITASGSRVGGIVGNLDTSADYDGTVENCSANVTISGVQNLGGIIGIVSNGKNVKVKGCSSTASVTGSATDSGIQLGGLIGCIANIAFTSVSVDNCSSAGSVTCKATANNANTGGLVGIIYYGEITKSHSSCTVTSTRPIVGGLVGYMHGSSSISQTCYATGNISGTGNIGGLVGSVNTSATTAIADSYYSGTKVEGTEARTGGIAGYDYKGAIKDCYVSGSSISSKSHNVGGIAGEVTPNGGISSCYAKDVTVSTNSNTVFNIGGIAGIVSKATVDHCFVTGTVSQGTRKGGIVGLLYNGGKVENCYFNGTISNGNNNAGGIVGLADTGTISNCYSTGSATGSQRIAGICGFLSQNVSIEYCYSTCAISGTMGIGGITGIACRTWPTTSPTAAGSEGTISYTTDFGNSVKYCIAGNSSVQTTGTPSATNGNYSCGVISGCNSGKTTFTKNYRMDGITFKPLNSSVTAIDQEDTDATHPLAQQVNYNHQYPYHGKSAARAWTDASATAPSSITISALAQQMGWSTTNWNFPTDANPTLKDMPTVQ